jgi:hypothetical protein
MFNLDHLTEEQRTLLSELVENELSGLPVEIRHTRNIEMRKELHHRMQVAQELYNRLHEASVV